MDSSPAHSPSPDRRFSKLLKHTSSRKSNIDSSSSSLAVADSSTGDPSGFRKSIDRGITSLKEKARKDSSDNGPRRRSNSDSRRKLSRLMPKRSRTRLREGDNDSGSEYNIDGEAASSSLRPDSQAGSKLNLNASIESFGKSAASSLLTDDEDSERPSSRPDLASRASHKGYLTFSSPLIAAETVDAPNNLAQKSQTEAADTPTLKEEPSTLQHIASAPSTGGQLQSRARSPSKASTFPRQESQRPASAASSKPLVTISTASSDRPQTPSTYITPPTPVVNRSPSPPKSSGRNSSKSSLSLGTLPTKTLSAAPKDTLTHRRARSASNKTGAAPPPLTPHVEEAKTPGGSVIQPSGSSGFFASVFSATQNAVTQISNSFNNQQAGNRSRSATASSAPTKQGESETASDSILDPTAGLKNAETAQKQEPAIATLGSGNLSLTHLGISDASAETSSIAGEENMADVAIRSRANTLNSNARASAPASTQDDATAAEAAVSAAYGGRTPSEKSVPIVVDSNNDGARPRSISSIPTGINGETPQRSVTQSTDAIDGGSIKRAGSVRSRISGRGIRHRNSSAAGGAIAAALSASHGAIANPGNRRPTGFAVANEKRNKDFHRDFKSVPEDDHLIDDFSAALQKDILLHGRFYISEQHVCFSSNILGWTTNVVMSFDEVVAIEKKSTAMIFPNAIVIQTLHAKYVFASLINRDATYDLLIRIWRIGHPNLKVTDAGHSLDESAADKGDTMGSPESTGSSDDETGDEDEDDEDYQEDGASSVGRPPSVAPSEAAETVRHVSKTLPPNGSPSAPVNGTAAKSPEAAAAAPPAGQDFPGPAQHGVTQCTDVDAHYANQVLDTTVPAPLGKIYSIWFGPESGKIMRKFLVDDQKSTDLQLEDDGKGMGDNAKSMSCSYIKPLGGSIGPKQTKCLVNMTLDTFDLEKAVSVTCATQTPDVPSGNVFVTKTKYCLMWGPGNSTRIIMTCTVEWSGKSWLKGPIEKGANDGQVQYGKDIAAFFKSFVASKAPARPGKGGKTKGRKKKSTADLGSPDRADTDRAAAAAKAKSGSNGILGQLSDMLGPVGDMIGSLISPVGILSALLVMMVILYWRQSYRVGGSADAITFSGLATPERLAAYDQLWKREEDRLWEWLETRIRLDDVGVKAQLPPIVDDKPLKSMSDRQVDDAIRVTEERLQALKGKRAQADA